MKKLHIFLLIGFLLGIVGLCNTKGIAEYIERFNSGVTSAEVVSGLAYMEEEKYEEAILCFNDYLGKRFVSLNKNVLELVYYQKALACEKLYMHMMSEKYIDLAISINEASIDEKRIKANSLCYRGAYAEALELYDELITLNPDNDLLLARGDCYAGMEQYDRAKEDYKKVFEDDPSFLRFQGYISFFYRIQENEGAKKVCLDYIDNLQSGRYTAEDKNEALNYAYSSMGDADMSLGRYKDALQSLEAAIEFDKEDSYSVFRIAMCWAVLKNYDLAANNLEKACNIHGSTHYLFEAAEYYTEFEDFVKTELYRELEKRLLLEMDVE